MRFLLALVLAAAPAAAQHRDALPVPDLPGYRTLKCDFHTHTVFSDGEVWPTTRVVEAWREGLDAIAITDHAGYNPHEKDLKPDLERPHAIALPLAEQLGLILVPGVEIAERDFHCNALFVTDVNAFFNLGMAEALEVARKQDAFVFWNHPGWKETPQWEPPASTLYERGLIQGFELANETTVYEEAFPWAREYHLAIFANSDIHVPTTSFYTPRERPVTLVFVRTANLAGIREALLARRTAAWVNGEVWGAEEHLAGLWQGAVWVENPEVRLKPGDRLALRLHNRSAIPFRIRVTGVPSWLRIGDVEVRPEGVVGVVLSVSKNAPPGTHEVELDTEVGNLHITPERNLSVRLPLRIEISK
jgi:3',5'-nucleoside bisphosphate phosphatase